MELLRFLLRTSRLRVVLAVLAAMASGVATVAVLVFARRWLRHADELTLPLAATFVGVCVTALATRIAAQALLVSLSRRAVARLTLEMSKQVLAAPLDQLEAMGPARVQSVLTQDLPAISQGLNAVPQFSASVALATACMVYLCVLSPAVFGILLIPLAFGLVVQRLLMSRARIGFRRSREGQEDLVVQLRELGDGIKELKIHEERRKAFLEKALLPAVEEQEKASALTQFYMSLSGSWGRLLLFLLIGFLLIAVPAIVPGARDAVGGYLLAVFLMLQPLGGMQMSLAVLGRARISLARVRMLGMRLTAEEEAAPPHTHEAVPWKALELVGLTYSYEQERGEKGFTLGPIDLTFRPGELVFLGGGNGSGKTTFAKLLLGLYAPTQGEIRLDGAPVTQLEGYRRHFSVIFSEFHLFPSLWGLDHSDRVGKVDEYLKRLELDHKVEIEDGTFSTTALSRGQQKRLALLIALLEDRSFYVFDEWAADQDPHFKDVFYREILPDLKARGKTVLAITHDDRYYPLADRLLLLEDGKLRPR